MPKQIFRNIKMDTSVYARWQVIGRGIHKAIRNKNRCADTSQDKKKFKVPIAVSLIYNKFCKVRIKKCERDS